MYKVDLRVKIELDAIDEADATRIATERISAVEGVTAVKAAKTIDLQQAVKRGRPQVLSLEGIEEAIKLCSRTEGATSDELGEVMKLPPVDAPWRLRWWIEHKRPEYAFSSRQMTAGQRMRHKYVSSNARIFRIRPAGAPPEPEDEEQKET